MARSSSSPAELPLPVSTPDATSTPRPRSAAAGNNALVAGASHGVKFGKTSVVSEWWSRVKRECGTGSIAQDSLPWTDTTDSSDGTDDFEARRRAREEAILSRRSSRHSDDEKREQARREEDEDEEEVDEVVVDQLEDMDRWLEKMAEGEDTSTAAASWNARARTEGYSGPDHKPGSTKSPSLRSFAGVADWTPVRRMSTFVRCSITPILKDFFAVRLLVVEGNVQSTKLSRAAQPRYPDEEMEAAFRKELWFTQKRTHIAGSFLVLFTALLQIGGARGPITAWNRASTDVIAPVLSLAIILGSLFNLPWKRRWTWQALCFVLVVVATTGFIIDLHVCRELTADPQCANKDFMSGFLFATAYPVIGLFALGQTRGAALIGHLAFTILSIVLIAARMNVNFLRDLAPWFIFQVFMLVFHYYREASDRRTYSLRMEVKIQYRAKQRAQINERKTLEAKRRFSNYIFHEVRVPLNTAQLAFQNLQAAKIFKPHTEHELEVSALKSSLAMMSTVLNDVLDMARMEKGAFSSLRRPFSFHGVVKSILGPLELDATARGLRLTHDLDPKIDEAAARASRSGRKRESWSCNGIREGDGILLGDETRIRQVINNLASNACKFTKPGGKIHVVTKLIFPDSVSFAKRRLSISRKSAPDEPGTISASCSDSTAVHAIDLEKGEAVSELALKIEEDCIAVSKSLVVRVEVHDSGVGIRKCDTQDGKMFSAYHQNSQTLQQGGKGVSPSLKPRRSVLTLSYLQTGLGLSLAKHIIALSGGRLGVKSRVGQNSGSCFWFELALGTVPIETLEAACAQEAALDGYRPPDPTTPNTFSDKSDYEFSLPSKFGSPAPTSSIFSSPSLASPRFVSSPEEEVLASRNSNGPASSFFTHSSTLSSSTSSGGAALSPSSSVGTSTPTLSSVAFKGPRMRVLAVDDDLLTRKLMSRMLSRLGADVATAEDGAVALDMLLGAAPGEGWEIIFLDNQMPNMTGLQLASRLKGLPRSDYIVGVTANATHSDQQEFIDAGASLVLTKPVKEADLRKILASRREAPSTQPSPESSKEPPDPTTPTR